MLADCARNRKVATLVQRCKKENFHTGAKENLGEATARDDSIPARDDPVRDDPSETIRFRCETIRDGAIRCETRRSGRDTVRYGAIRDDSGAIRFDSGARRFDTDDTSAIRTDSGEKRSPRGQQPARLARRGA